jgi:hypothetical protein
MTCLCVICSVRHEEDAAIYQRTHICEIEERTGAPGPQYVKG